MRAALVLCAGFSSLAFGQAWWGRAKLDGKSCLKVQQGINNATGAAAQGHWEDAIAFETEALSLLEVSGTKDGEPRQWKECDTSEGYDKAKHGYLHFRLAVALQEQGRPDDALRNFDHARTFDKDLDVDATLNMGLLSLHLNRLIDAELYLTNVVRAISKLSEISTERRDKDGEHEGVLRAMAALGDVYARQMRVDQAKSTYKRVLQASPGDTETLLKLGSLEQWLGGLRHEPMQWVDALTAHASALRSPKMKAASEKPKTEEAEAKQGASLAAAYRSAPEIHLRMAGLLELVANHGTTGRGLIEAQQHVASALEMVDTGTALGWRALFTQLRLDTRLCAWQQLRPQTAVTADFLQTALHTRPPTEEETAEAIAAAEMAAAKADAEEEAAEEEMAKLSSRERKQKRKESANRKKRNAKTLEQLLAAQEAIAMGFSTGNIPTIPLTPFELWELPYVSEVGTLAAAAARAQGLESTAQQQLVAAQARLNVSGDGRNRTPSAPTPRFAGGVAVPESRRAQVAVLFPSWWNDAFLAAFLAMMRALADTTRLEMVIYNLAGDATKAAAAIKALCEETWEVTDGAIRMVEGGYLDDPTTLASLTEQELDVLIDLQGHLPASRPGLLPGPGLSNLTGIEGREVWRLAVPIAWAATAASLTVVPEPAPDGNSSNSSGVDVGGGSVAGGPHGLIADRISAPPEMGWHYAEDLHYLDAPWPWGWDGPDAEAAAQVGATDAATVGRLRARAAHGVSPNLLDAWVQTAQRTRATAKSVASLEKEQELMIVEVLEEARPQLRNESHARGYTALDFEVGPPPPPAAAATPEETPPRPLAVILESNMECAAPKLTSLRRALVRGSPAIILPGQGMCSRAAAATAVSLGRGFGPLVSSYKEYVDTAVALAAPVKKPARSSAAEKHPGAWGAPPPRWDVASTPAGIDAAAVESVKGAQEGGVGETELQRWATGASALILSGGVLPAGGNRQ